MDKTTLTFEEVGAIIKPRKNHAADTIDLDFKTLIKCKKVL